MTQRGDEQERFRTFLTYAALGGSIQTVRQDTFSWKLKVFIAVVLLIFIALLLNQQGDDVPTPQHQVQRITPINP